jgi:hypothetical protein
MKKFFFSVVFLSAFIGSARAESLSCLTPAQTRTSYNACISFLKFSPAKQKKVAAGTGYSLSAVTKACQLQKSKGLKSMLANSRQICAYLDAKRNQAPGFGTPYEPKAPLCSSMGDCRGGYCSAGNECRDGGWNAPCDKSSQCASGYCYGSGTCQ